MRFILGCALLIYNPCMPPYLGFVFYKEDTNQCNLPEGCTIPMILLLIDTSVLFTVFSLPPIHTFHGVFSGPLCLDTYIKMLIRFQIVFGSKISRLGPK